MEPGEFEKRLKCLEAYPDGRFKRVKSKEKRQDEMEIYIKTNMTEVVLKAAHGIDSLVKDVTNGLNYLDFSPFN